jgi:hypothetical protein
MSVASDYFYCNLILPDSSSVVYSLYLPLDLRLERERERYGWGLALKY